MNHQTLKQETLKKEISHFVVFVSARRKKRLSTDGRTDQLTDRPTNRPTDGHTLLKSRGSRLKTKARAAIPGKVSALPAFR